MIFGKDSTRETYRFDVARKSKTKKLQRRDFRAGANTTNQRKYFLPTNGRSTAQPFIESARS
jgi:hypothetical protein